MIIQGSVNTNRDNILIEEYKNLIKSGVNPNDILVLLLNSYKKSLFINEIQKYSGGFDLKENQIHTIYGLCYNCFKNNENYLKGVIKTNDSASLNLCGLEVSQYIFKNCIKEADFSDYISKVNLLHQLFRRYSLIVQNDLSNEEIIKRSKLLKESFYKDAQKAINNYKLKTIEYKSFDYLRQLATLPVIYNATGYFKNIKYLFVFDADELSYAIWQFIYKIIPQLKNYYIAYDKNGSSRCGYLCAYKSGAENLKNNLKCKEVILEDKTKFSETAQELYENIRSGKRTSLKGFEHNSSILRLDMIGKVLNDVHTLLNQGVKASEISIITPIPDDILVQTMNSNNFSIKFQIISGSSKLSDNKLINHLIQMLKLVNSQYIKDFEVKSLLNEYLKIPYRRCRDVINGYREKKVFEPYDFGESVYNEKYTKFLNIINSLKVCNQTLTEEIKIIYTNLFNEEKEEKSVQKYLFLLKEAQSFEEAFKNTKEDIAQEFILQIENSIISENPMNSFSLEEDSIVISTAQKIIDYNIKTKYQFWLDISNGEWFKQDTGTLYNSWVFNRDWNKSEYTLTDNIELTRDKTARIVRKTVLCAKEEIKLYSSLYDNSGNENFMGLTDYIESESVKKPEFEIIPRDDQKPVLEYKGGKMGIMAVPGAGKTTILLALILKLLKSGVSSNNIFVLTYMESAAKNFKEKIKLALPDNSDLPNISTIHGLALRIIKENGNYVKTGLDENFEICDDTEKERIIREIFYKRKINEDKYENYLKSISAVKLSSAEIELKSKYKDIQEFFDFLNAYNAELKQRNLIDYDDMLRFALKILESDKDTREYYQNLCRYIIEDEAQDSSQIQQTLINILAGKYKNIVRCGDINQSITSTFTNADLESFKKFINSDKKVEMHSSQRCSKPIYELANNLINYSKTQENMHNAFYSINITGTTKNPKNSTMPEFIEFERDIEEKEFILNKIKEIKKVNKTASIAVLLRINSEVNEYNEFLNSKGIKTSIRSDCLSQKRIFKYIIEVLNIIENPSNNNYVVNLCGLYKEKYPQKVFDEAISSLKTLKTPFPDLNADELDNELLMQLYWDIDYWLNNSNKPAEEIALKAGLYYSEDSSDKSNTYLISTFIKHLNNTKEEQKDLINTIQYNAQKPLSAYKFFEDEKQGEESGIKIMTMHKSKGDEFDYVFIPQLNEDNYSINPKTIKLKSGSHFVQTIKNIVNNSAVKSIEELKTEQIEETLRLLYVGITRAKQELYMTNAKFYRTRKNTVPCRFLKDLIFGSTLSSTIK